MALANPRSVLQILVEPADQGGGSPRRAAGRTDRASTSPKRTSSSGDGYGQWSRVERRGGQKLFRPTEGTTETRGGLGIGLIVSKALAERQGGALSFAPAPGRRCVFALTLPVAPSEA